MDPIGLMWFAAGIAAMPPIWKACNIIHDKCVNWWETRNCQWQKREDEARAERENARNPARPVWCMGCGEVRTLAIMAWDEEGDDYLCGFCLGVPKLLAVLSIWHKWHLRLKWDCGELEPIYNADDEVVGYGENRGDDLVVINDNFNEAMRWPGWGGEQIMNGALPKRRFNELGLEVDAAGTPLHIARYQAHGVTTNEAMNAAYEKGIAARARKRKRRKENLMWRKEHA
jgi:hypothetical protein